MYSEPWFREFDGWWYCYVRTNGQRKQVRLAKGREGRAEAFERWHKLCAAPQTSAARVSTDSVPALLDQFLEHCQRNRSRGTYAIYAHHLTGFCRHIGPRMTVGELRPLHVSQWIDRSTWSDSTKAGAVQTVRTAFLWLTREGYISTNPVAGVKGPSKRPREVILTAEQYAAVLKHSQPDFCRLLEFLRATGCRPQEARAIEARHVELSQRRVVFPPSESKGKRHPRVIYLSNAAFDIVADLCRQHPHGVLFRTAKGEPWNRNMIRCRFARLGKKLGTTFCAYHLRHTFATNALQRLDPITVATLMGHADASTLARNYQHLAKLPAFMQDAARKATD